MANTILEPMVSNNPYLEELDHISPAERAASTWLIISHDDPTLVRRIHEAMENEQAIVLQIPQCDWGPNRERLAQAIVPWLQTSGVSHMALLGHSQANAAVCRTRVVGKRNSAPAPTPAPAETDSYKRLLDSLQATQASRETAKQDIVEQFCYFSEHPGIQKVADTRGLQLHAFFYMAESGLFLKYNDSQQGFEG